MKQKAGSYDSGGGGFNRAGNCGNGRRTHSYLAQRFVITQCIINDNTIFIILLLMLSPFLSLSLFISVFVCVAFVFLALLSYRPYELWMHGSLFFFYMTVSRKWVGTMCIRYALLLLLWLFVVFVVRQCHLKPKHREPNNCHSTINIEAAYFISSGF